MENAIRIQAEEIRTLLREKRIALGLSIRQAARAAGVPPQRWLACSAVKVYLTGTTSYSS